METVKFQTNVPETIALAFAQGKPVTSQFSGDQVMFSLDDGRRMYVSPFVAEKIYEAGVSAHTPFTICKREVSHGNRRSVEFQIETHNAAGTAQAPTAAPIAPESSQTKAIAISNSYTDASTTPKPAAAPAAATVDAETAAMLDAHKRAIYVAAMAEAYAAEAGLAIRYAAEDIRAIAATLYIQAAKGGAR